VYFKVHIGVRIC